MRLGYPSLTIRSIVGSEPELVVVTATDALRLCRQEGYEAVRSYRARPWLDGLSRSDLARVRAFLAQTRLPRAPGGMSNDADVLARLMGALRTRALVVVRHVGGAAGGEGGSADQRRLVRAIEARTRGRLSFGGRQYKLVADVDLPGLRNRDSYEVVRKAEALRIMGELASHSDGHADGLAALLGEASSKLTADWRPPLQPDGLILLRRLPVLASASDLAPAVTPSQLKQMLGKSDYIELEVTDDEGEPYAARYRLELTDGQKLEGRLGPDGFFGKYDIDSGNCKLVLLTGMPLSGSFVEEPDEEPEALAAITPDVPAADVEGADDSVPSFPECELPPPLAEFSVTVVDARNRPLTGVGLRFCQGTMASVVTTDGDGVAVHEGLSTPAQVSFADAKQVADALAALEDSRAASPADSAAAAASDATVVVSRPDTLESADGTTFTAIDLAAGESKTLSIRPGMRRAVLLEMHDALFRTDSAVVNPEGEAPSDAVASHEALTSVGLIATALRYNEEHPGKKLFIAGHADRAGSEANNVTLSEHRAKAVLALLEGDKAAYVAACKAKHSEVDVTQLFDWTHHHPSFLFDCSPTTLKAAPSNENYYLFRTSYNKWVDGAPAGEVRGTRISPTGRLMDDIWSAMFDLYEFALREELAEDPAGLAALRAGLVWIDATKKTVGYGESFPTVGNTPNGTRSQADRRVEVMFFDAGQEPDLAGRNGEDIYDQQIFERVVLPPLVSAKRWTPAWDETEVGWQGERAMVVTAPDLPPGLPVTFQVLLDGAVVGTASGTSGAGTATGTWNQWFFEDKAVYAGELPEGSALARVEFHFVMEAGGRRVQTTAACAYVDALIATLVTEQGDAIPSRRYLLVTYYGSRWGQTDAFGGVLEGELPPGGFDLLLDGENPVDFSQLQHA